MATDIIPIVDFSGFSVDLPNDKVDQKSVDRIAKELIDAFADIGFVYIINHGITPDVIDKAYQNADKLFALPRDIKTTLKRPDSEVNHGWVQLEQESLNPDRPADYKECYNVTPRTATKWPDEHVPEFKPSILKFFGACDVLSLRMLEAMAIGLGLERNFFTDYHNTFTEPNMTTMRCLYYPAVPKEREAKPNQVRCGEHSDYGSITLLFQDDAGGLEVLPRSGQYVAARPVPGAVIVNIGDLMMRWTSDKLVSTKHRVMMPTGFNHSRRSIAFFVHPDDGKMITCIDGTNKYQPITSGDYLKMRFSATYMT